MPSKLTIFETSPISTGVRDIAKLLGAYQGYQKQSNDMWAVKEPYRYFVSRCIDRYLALALAYMRWELGQTVHIQDIDQLCASTGTVTACLHDSEALVLAAILRPSVEMYAALLNLQRYVGSPELLEILCRLLLLNHTTGDFEQKLKACADIYECRPSYFEAIVQGHRSELDQIRSKLRNKGVSPSAKYAEVFKAGSNLDRVMLGADSFLSEASLSYKLHFLPQKSVHESAENVAFLSNWSGTLLIGLGMKLRKFAGEPVNAADEAALEALNQKAANTSSVCPKVGDLVFCDWGVGSVEEVEEGPLVVGNEVLVLRYVFPFVDGLKAPDRIPRRFTKVRLNRSLYDSALQTEMTKYQVTDVDALIEAVTRAGARDAVYQTFYACRV